MRKVTQAERDKIWEDVRKEFPNDEMMQEIHFIRQVHYLQTKDLSMEERLRFFESSIQQWFGHLLIGLNESKILRSCFKTHFAHFGYDLLPCHSERSAAESKNLLLK